MPRKYIRSFLALLPACLIVVSPENVNAAYDAKYIKSLGSIPACEVTFKTSHSASYINEKLNSDAARTFCFEPGDYTDKGTITLTKDGTSSRKRWIRLAGASKTHPYRLTKSRRATLKFIVVEADWWIVHRIAFDSEFSGSNKNEITSTSQNVIFDSLLMENGGQAASMMRIKGADDFTIQNSLLNTTKKVPKVDMACIAFGSTCENVRIINNEFYNCAGDSIVINKKAPVPGLIVENNDMYLTPEYYVADGTKACAENAIDFKAAGKSSNPVQIIHNRMWGFRPSATSCATSGSSGEAINIHEDDNVGTSDHVLVKNNIIFDSPRGISSPNGGTEYVSIIGNIFYNIHSETDKTAAALDLVKLSNVEVYLNTIIDTNSGYWLRLGARNQDIRCNVVIDGRSHSGSPGSNVSIGYNAFYNTSATSAGGIGGNDLSRSSRNDSMSKDFCFDRQLITGPDKYCIPYALPTSSSPHLKACTTELGSDRNNGIDHGTL